MIAVQNMFAALISEGLRLHLQQGPIDLIIGADGDTAEMRQIAFQAATARFETVLQGLVEDLARHRSALKPQTPCPADPIAQRMYRAARPFCTQTFLTPMIAVAGAVADEVLQAMLNSANLSRAYVNNGGDIAVHLAKSEEFSVAIFSSTGDDLGRMGLDSESGIRGIATSGAGGRSFSLGIAESVTVVAASAAQADVAATLIANAVDLPGNKGILRAPAADLRPDSDLGSRLVVTSLPRLTPDESIQALSAGKLYASEMVRKKQILGAAMYLQGHIGFVGTMSKRICANSRMTEMAYV